MRTSIISIFSMVLLLSVLCSDAAKLKVGYTFSGCGPLADEFSSIRGGLAAFQQRTAQDGFLIGNQRYDLELLGYDDGGSVSSAAAIVEKMIIVDKVNVLIGTQLLDFNTVPLSNAVFEIANRYGVPVLNIADTHFYDNPNFNSSFIFTLVPDSDDLAGACLRYFHDNGARTVAFASGNGEGQILLGDAFITANETDFVIVGNDRTNYTDGDSVSKLDDLVRAWGSHGADILFGGLHDEANLELLARIYGHHLKPSAVFLWSGPQRPNYRIDQPWQAENTFTGDYWEEDLLYSDAVWSTSNDAPKQFANYYATVNGGARPDSIAAASATALEAAVLAAQLAQSTDSLAIANALKSLNVSTILGPVSFAGTRRQVEILYECYQLQQGGLLVPVNKNKSAIVWPGLSRSVPACYPHSCSSHRGKWIGIGVGVAAAVILVAAIVVVIYLRRQYHFMVVNRNDPSAAEWASP